MHDSGQTLFPQALLSALRDAPERCAFEQGARRVSRGALLALIGRLAAALRDAGLAPGRTLALYTSVSPEAFAAQIAAYTLGCRVVGVRPGYTERQLAHVLAMQVDAVLVDA